MLTSTRKEQHPGPPFRGKQWHTTYKGLLLGSGHTSLSPPPPPSCYQPGLLLGSGHTSLSPPPPPSCYQPGLLLGSSHTSSHPSPTKRLAKDPLSKRHMPRSPCVTHENVWVWTCVGVRINPAELYTKNNVCWNQACPDLETETSGLRSINNTKKIRSQENVFELRIIRINEV